MNLEEYAKKIGNERFLSSDEIEVLLKTINSSNAFTDRNGEIEQWDDRSRIVRGMIEAIHIIRDHISVYGTNSTRTRYRTCVLFHDSSYQTVGAGAAFHHTEEVRGRGVFRLGIYDE